MKLTILLLTLAFFNCGQVTSPKKKMEVTKLTCEYKINPSGVNTANPGLGWQLASEERNQSQTAYQIMVSDNPELLKSCKGNIWDSKKVNSDQSTLVKYNGSPLKSGEKYYWRVKTWDKDGKESSWSETASWQMGLLTEADWKGAKWIGYEDMPDEERLVPGLHQGTDKNSTKAKKRTVIPYSGKSSRF
jgi:hypothetical protein